MIKRRIVSGRASVPSGKRLPGYLQTLDMAPSGGKTHACRATVMAPGAQRRGPRGAASTTAVLAAASMVMAGFEAETSLEGRSRTMVVQNAGPPVTPIVYGYRSGMRTPEPGEIKLQGWVAVAEGATGVVYYAGVADGPGQHQMWDIGWTETANTRAAGELFARLKQLGPVLCRLERDYREKEILTVSNPRVLAHRFTARLNHKLPGTYLVLASLDGFGPQSFDLALKTGQPVYDLVRRTEITGKTSGMRLGPGEGTVLLVGSAQDFQAACKRMQ